MDSSDPTKVIPNAKFRIAAVDGSFGPEEYVTDAKGEIELDHLTPGAYVVTEVECPGYIIDEAQRIIQLDGNETAQFVFTNSAKPTMRLTKTGADGSKLAGVTFRIAKVGDSANYLDRTTDAQGEIEISDLDPGIYTVQETATLPDYMIDPAEYRVELFPGKTSTITLTNDKRPNLTIRKTDKASGDTIAGVTFTLRAADGPTITTEPTGPDGTITIPNLLPGVYVVTEQSVPEGYILDETPQTVTLAANRDAKLQFQNSRRPSLTIRKTDKDTGAELPGVTFTLKGVEGPTITTEPTGPDGTVTIHDLLPGAYVVTEQSVPEGYILDETPQTVTLFPDKDAKVQFQNHQRPWLVIRKTDKDTGATITGVTFTLRVADGPTITTEPTGPDGTVTIRNLLPGVYTVTEQSVPEGYILDETPQTITLVPGKEAKVQFQNYQRPTLTICKIDADGNFLTGATFEVKAKDGAKIGDFQVDKNGKITIANKNLTEGYYIITEKQAPDGYILNPTPHEVYLRPGKTTEVSIKNDRKPNLTIHKNDADTGKPVPDTVFEIRAADGHSVDEVKTDASGVAVLEKLLPGVYEITEKSVPGNYLLDSEPQLVTLYANRDHSVNFENHQRPTLVIAKVDINGKFLTGAIFEVKTKAGVKIGDFPVGADGKITIPQTKLADGYYIITEIQAPEGYILDSTPHEVYLRPGQTTEVSIENEQKPGLVIQKLDSVVKDGLKGAKFEIFVSKDKSQHGTYQKLNDTFYYTDEKGVIFLPGLDTGWYKIVEVEPPDGYLQKEPAEQYIYVEHDKTTTVTFENIPKSALVIRKIDSDTGAPLANAWFRVRYLGGTSGSGGTIIGEFNTSSNGNIILTGLDAGTYICEEINAPNGYVMDTAPQTAYLSGKEQDCIILTFTNSKNGSLLVKKVDSNTKEPLSDVQFFITTSDGSVVGNSNGYFTTDSAGTILIPDITPGTTLVVKETRTRPGYVLDDAPQTVKITSNETKTLEFRNAPKGGLIVHKIDGVTGESLAGVQFRITTASGELLTDNEGLTASNGIYTTDETGQIVLSKLSTGTYVVTETKTLENYNLDSTPRTVVVNAADTQTLTITNTPKGALVVWKYDTVTGAAIEGAVFQVKYLGGSSGTNGTLVGTYTTGVNGSFSVTGLSAGTYVVTEIASDNGHVIDSSPQAAYISGETQDVVQLYFGNAPKGSLLIKKIDSVTHKPLSDVEFMVTDSDGTVVGNRTGTFVTDSAGTILIEGIAPGSVLLAKETEAKPGYVIDDAPQTAEIKPGQTVMLEFRNAPKGGLIIRKTDSVTGKPLSGVQFKITTASGELVADNEGLTSSNGMYTTDADGQIVLNKLQPGVYVVTETQTVDGYIMDAAPQTVQVGASDTQTLTFTNTPMGGLLVKKMDAVTREPLTEVIFKITRTDGTVVGTSNGEYRTDERGYIAIPDLEPGGYIVQEVQAKAGYVLDNTPKTVEVKDHQLYTLEFFNQPYGGLTIVKKDSVTGQFLQGVQFRVTDANGEPVANNGGSTSTNGYYTTDSNGQITINTLKPGTYFVTETKAIEGYNLDAEPQSVVVKAGDIQTVTLTNTPMGGLLIKKMDSVTREPLADVVFKVTRTDGTVVGNSNGEYRTDERGYVAIPDVEPGSYIVQEVQAKAGYVLDNTPKSVEVKDHQLYTLEFFNQPYGGLTIVKKDSVTGQFLPGVQFRVTDANGEPVANNGGATSTNGYYTTDSSGQITINTLKPGTYFVTETKAIEGYNLDAEPQSVVVKAGDIQTVTLTNTPMGGLLIKKMDSVTREPLADVIFKVTRTDGTVVGTSNGEYRTDEQGCISIPDVEPGGYIVQEVQAKAGYLLDSTPKSVQVKDHQTYTLDFYNQPLGGLVIRKVDSVSKKPLAGVEFKITTSTGALVSSNNGTTSSNGVFTTDNSGEIHVNTLKPGTYVITEAAPLPGYTMDDASRTVAVAAGETQTITFTNTPTTTLVIQKFIAGTQNEPLAGVEFLVTDGTGAGVGADNGRYVTDKAGRIMIAGLEDGTNITVREVKTVAGYVLDGEPQSIQIRSGEVQTLTFQNQKAGSLVIKKLDSISKEPLAGVEFKLTYTDGSFVDADNGTVSSKGLYTTDSNGEIAISGIVGNIVVTETKTIPGYTIDEGNRSQTVKVNANDAQTLTFYNTPTTTLVIQKFVEGTANEPLAGVEFLVTDGKGTPVGPDNGKYVTDKNGRISIPDLSDGTNITARETKTVDGFILDGAPQSIQIEAGEVQTLTFWNKRDCSLSILKQSTSKTPLTGAVFLVTDEDGAAIGTNNGRYTTDRNGLITITGLQPGQILIVTEEQAPNGYVKDATPKTIKIKEGVANSLIFENAKTGTLVINKRSSVDKATPLEGVTFKITTTGGSFLPDADGKISSNGLYYTDENGQIILSSVVGSLLVTEVQSIDGYTIHEANRTQTVEVAPDDTQTLYFYNDPLCSLTLTKLDSVTGKPVPGTEFTVKDGSGTVLGRYTTGQDGTVTVTGLLPNSTVVVTETKVPTGYVLNSTPQTITVKNGTDNSVISGAVSSVSTSSGNDLVFENDPTTTLVIQKYVDGTENQPMKGVEFLVTESSGKVVGPDNGYFYTDKDGRISISNLEPGMTVTARETKTLAGYVLDGTPQTVQIKAGESQSLTFWNKKAGSLTIKKVDSITKKPLAGVQFKVAYANGSVVDNANGTVSSNGLYTTDTNGEIVISGIVGSIVVTETKTIPGYTINEAARSQTVTVNADDAQTLTFENVPTSSLVIEKYIEGTDNEPLPGVEFLVTDGTGAPVGPSNGRYVTDKDGRITIADLPDGANITAKETKTAEGYILDNSPQTIQIKAGEVRTLTFYNKKTGNLIVKKIDSDTKEPLAGVQFKITYTDGRFVDLDGGQVSSNGIYVTDANGQITISGIVGSVVVEETKTLPGYIMDTNTRSQTVKINPNDTQTLTFENVKTGGLMVKKMDSVTKKPLEGVEFKITYTDGRYVDLDSRRVSSKGIYWTDENGEIFIDSIVGNVVVMETKTIDGYTIDEAKRSQTVQINPNDTQTVYFYNEPLCSLTLTKLDSITGKPVPGTEFTVKDGNGTVLGRYTTGQDGTVTVTGLQPNSTVVVTETKVPTGYVLNPTPQTIIVKNGSGNSIVSGVNNSGSNGGNNLTFENDPTTTLVIEKYVDGADNQPMQGVEFLVTDGTGAPVGPDNGRFVTDKDGRISIPNLEPGMNVTARETKTLAGYILDNSPQTIRIKAGEVQTLIFKNKKAGNLIIKKLDANTKEPLAGVEFKVTYSDGSFVDAENGTVSTKGLYTTDRNGEITISGIVGSIVVTETRTIDGYTINENERSQTVQVSANDTQTVTFYNVPKTTLTIQKYIEGTNNEPISGVEFLVTDDTGAVVGPDNGHYRTDKDGRIVIADLADGTVLTVRETKAADGYLLDSTPQTIRIKSGEAQSLTFWNQRLATLVIKKMDSATKEPLSDVTFRVTRPDGSVVGVTNGEFRTDERGFITITDVEPGDYIITEVKAKTGYLLDDSPRTVAIKENKTYEIEIFNQPMGNLVIHKLDSATKKPLAGVQFKITYADGRPVDAENGKLSTNGLYTTDESGQIKISGITGTLVITEMQTIPGYTIDENSRSQTVVVNADDTQSLTFYNAPTQTLTIQKLISGTADEPLANVEFLITDSSGAVIGPNNGIYRTDQYGRITLTDLVPGTVITAKETKTVDGYVLDGTPQSIEIKSGEAQTLTFYNAPVGGLELIKVDEADKSKRITGVTFEIRKMDGGLVDTITTGDNGRAFKSLDAGDYYLVEIECPKEYKVDPTPHYFTIQNSGTTTVTVTNKAFSGILIHKTDSVTGKGIYGVTFLLYDSGNNPVGQYTSDNNGYVYIEGITKSGRYSLRELENKGYILDTQMKTVYVTPGETTLVEWQNIPITAQIQITKKSAEYNSTNGLPAGTLLEGAVFEIFDKASNLVDTIRSDSRGLAVSRPLPLGRYTIREVKAPDNYGVSDTELTAYLEHEGEIVRFEVTNKSLSTGVSITKTGPKEVMAGQPVRYNFSGIANNSNVRLDSFYWRDTLPAEVRLDTVVTGTYNFPGTYKITYRVNGGEPRTLADSLSTSKNYTLAASNTALGLASNERVTEIMFVFGQAPAGFAQVEAPYFQCTAVSNLKSASFVNVADVGGVYNGVWVQAVSRWVTTVYKKSTNTTLPRTGY